MNKLFTYLLFSLIVIAAFAQKETLMPLKYHPIQNDKTNKAFLQKKANSRITSLSLPFFDDFYQTAIFPDVSLWEDNFVFINTTYPKETVTVGVATFDGTDASGKPYSSSATLVSGAADKLTSNPIDLSGLTTDSNVFLSFYYLQGDFGETPVAPNDLLTVQFLDTSGNWNIMWQTTPDDIIKMRQVFLKVDSIYLNANFQFRFQSFGNLNGANDMWHIDYVKLDKNRDTAADRNIKEMAFEFLPPSLLKRYYVMPYNQFDTTDLADTVSILIKNNFNNVTTDFIDSYKATVVNTGDILKDSTGASIDFGPLTENSIKYPKFSIPTNITGDTVIIKVDYHFETSAEASEPPKVLANNSVTHNQVFSNFFAYDDGTPERGYWLADESNYRMAVKYFMRNPDTLQAIKLQLFPVRSDNSTATFSICVWKNFRLRSVYNPSDIIYMESNLKIADLNKEFGVDTLNGYYYAPIRSQFVMNGATYPLLLSDTFAIGVIVENPNSLTVGFDRNNNRSSSNFFVDANTEKWSQSVIPGTMIINPVVGKPLPDYLTPVKEIKTKKYEVKIYPNPAKNQLFIDGIQDKSLIEIYSLNGSLLKQAILFNNDFISINELPVATYVVRITNLTTNQSGNSKFIKGE